MRESWRWFGQLDRIGLHEIAQTGATGIVSALHAIPYGVVWPRAAIADRRNEITNAGFEWVVVESLPIHERIKRGDGNLAPLFGAYRDSMANLAAEGVGTICYNFMPLVDWTRTDLAAPLANGGTCLRYSAARMAAFDVLMLKRPGAEDDHPPEALAAGSVWYQRSSEPERADLLHAIMSGLPGSYDRYDVDGLRTALKSYEGIDADGLRENFRRFLREVVPAAEELGLRLCVHPDDPPRDLLGLPRIVSSEADVAWVLECVPSDANGLTFCTGSLGANPSNDLAAIARRFAEKIHFAHLRNVRSEPDGSFEEAAHLDGDTDMVAIISVLLHEEARRRSIGRADADIPFRPDHGHELLGDHGRGTHPGYPLIGRLRGLAELRGVVRALSHQQVRYG